MYRIIHENFCYITNDQDVVKDRLSQCYYVEKIQYYRQELYSGLRIVSM